MKPSLRHIAVFILLFCIPSAYAFPQFVLQSNHHKVHTVYLISSHAMKASTMGVQKSEDAHVSNPTRVPAFINLFHRPINSQVIAVVELHDASRAPSLSGPLVCILRT